MDKNIENLIASLVVFFLLLVGGSVGGCLASCSTRAELTREYNTKAVQSGCATRVLDTLSGDVKTVWKGEANGR